MEIPEPVKPKIEDLVKTNAYLKKIREVTNRGPYYLSREIPTILESENGRTTISLKAPCPDAYEALTTLDKSHVPCQKLKVKGAGDWEFRLGVVHMSHFGSRSEFDEFCIPENRRCLLAAGFNLLEDGSYVPYFDPPLKLSAREAFDRVGAHLKADMKYLRSNGPLNLKDKIETALLIQGVNPKKQHEELKRLEAFFFYKAMQDLIGEDIGPSDEEDPIITESERNYSPRTIREYMLQDFVCLHYDGNEKRATARRSDRYLFMKFDTS